MSANGAKLAVAATWRLGALLARSRHRRCRRAHGIFPAMSDENPAGIIARAIEEARGDGWDYIGQTEFAIRAVLAAQPEITASAAMLAVNRLRRE